MLKVTVAEDRSIKLVEIVKGPPLLAEGAKIDVKRWRFEPRAGAERNFELKCDFAVRVNEAGAGGPHTRTG
jgi:hypothetical protein